jgi:hypothetical protein
MMIPVMSRSGNAAEATEAKIPRTAAPNNFLEIIDFLRYMNDHPPADAHCSGQSGMVGSFGAQLTSSPA